MTGAAFKQGNNCVIVLCNPNEIPVTIINQIEHARIAGIIARYFDYKTLPAFTEKIIDHFIHAVTHHDDGWIPWENNPQCDARGIPLDFKNIPADDHMDIWKNSITELSKYHPYESWLVIGHALHLYTDHKTKSQLITTEQEKIYADDQIEEFTNWLIHLGHKTYSKITSMKNPWNTLSKPQLITHRKLLSFFDKITLVMLGAIPRFDSFMINDNLTFSLNWYKTDLSISPWPFSLNSITVDFKTTNNKIIRRTLLKNIYSE